jgi:hypothetical protein
MLKIKNLLIFATILIFIGVAVSPVIAAYNINTHSRKINLKNESRKISTNLLSDLKVYVKIKEIKALENPDPWPWAKEADFSIRVTIDGVTYSKSFDSDRNHLYPGWVASHKLDEDKKLVDITLKLIDRDPDADDVCDINPNVGVKSCNVVYNIDEGTWTGDDSGTGHAKGDGRDKPQCEIWFDIWHEKGERLKADANGPYQAKIGESIQLHGSATGGYPPYSWRWVFIKNGEKLKTPTEQNPVVTFYTVGRIDVFLEVKDSEGNRADDYTTLTIYEEEKKNKYVVLIAGGEGIDYPDWWPIDLADDKDFEEMTLYAYETFKGLGYSDENIYYLSGKHVKNGGDAKTTRENIKYAITKWLRSKSDKNSDIFIFLSGHGTYTGVSSIVAVHPGEPWKIWEVISSKELDSWLDSVEYSTCTVLIEACYSGGFISDLSDENRIVITATDKSHPAFAGSFPYPFFSELRKRSDTYKPSYADAWMNADKRVDGNAPDEQNPLIDDDGDGVGYGDSNVNELPNDKDGDGEPDPHEDGWLAMKTFP